MKRPEKIKLEVVKIPPNLHFSDSLGQRGVSVYARHLSEALNSGGAVKIAVADHYMRHQLRSSAVKLKVKLVFAMEGEFLYVKPLAIDGQLRRLILLLREPRSINELAAAKLELHLENSLRDLVKDGICHDSKGKWVLTEKGMDAL